MILQFILFLPLKAVHESQGCAILQIMFCRVALLYPSMIIKVMYKRRILLPYEQGIDKR